MSDLLLKPKEPEIELYEQGFENVCQLGRAAEGKKLSELVEAISEPMVIALDAPWGAGKTIFLKCWVGAHELENNGTAKTVFFDAFRHDYMDDPLVGLTSALSERLGDQDKKTNPLRRAKEAASKLARPALRIGLAVATSGATEVAGAVVDAGLKAGSKELEEASKKFWQKEDGKRAAMKSFRLALEQLASKQKLVIVVDELDRCRPDYALNLLEVIKHFFDVKNVHFVLGVNLKELANSVRARYGAGVQGERYLQKFVTLSMPLIPRKARSASMHTQIRHFNRISEEIGLSHSWKSELIADYLMSVDHHAGLSLRDVEKIATLAMVTPYPNEKPPAKPHLYVGAVVLQVLAPRILEKARLGQMTAEDFYSVFDLRNRNQPDGPKKEAHAIWKLVVLTSGNSTSQYLDDALETYYRNGAPRDLLREVIAETLDVFQLAN